MIQQQKEQLRLWCPCPCQVVPIRSMENKIPVAELGLKDHRVEEADLVVLVVRACYHRRAQQAD